MLCLGSYEVSLLGVEDVSTVGSCRKREKIAGYGGFDALGLLKPLCFVLLRNGDALKMLGERAVPPQGPPLYRLFLTSLKSRKAFSSVSNVSGAYNLGKKDR